MNAAEPSGPTLTPAVARRGARASIARMLLDGLLVVMPLAVIILLLHGILDRLRHATDPLAAHYVHPLVGAAVLFVLLCLLAGFLVRCRPGRLARLWLDGVVFDRIPGYRLVKAFLGSGMGLAGGTDARPQPALARIEEGLCPAFILDRLADGRLVVFVPSSPSVMSGSVYLFTPDRVVPIDVPMLPFRRAIASWGLGLRPLLEAAEARAASATLPTSAAIVGGRNAS